ncbi:MAG: solute:Na+ symporter, family [Bacteroidales bacterium]|nr:solute:Na+ symporter, family [Bacteroidales bacterium]MDN5329274.1 solute:Na+ symporter, family [Bacteroidales bacterium]
MDKRPLFSFFAKYIFQRPLVTKWGLNRKAFQMKHWALQGKLSPIYILFLVAYAIICIAIGLYSGRKQKSEDYMIAGRNVGIWGFVFSVVASYIGGAALVAYSAYVYRFGISALAVFAGTAAGFLVFIPYALKIRRISNQNRFFTLSDWFFFKYGRQTGLLSSIILFVVYFGMLVNQFIAGSSILSVISGWSYESSLIMAGLIISVYLFAGGFSSVIKTDIFQYLVLFVILLITGWLMFDRSAIAVEEVMDFSRMDTGMTIAFLTFGVFIVFQSAEYWQRVYAARDMHVVKNGLLWSAILVIITGLAITLIGLNAHHRLPHIPPENAFAAGISLIFPAHLLGGGLVLIFAAIMSSADTIIFVLASSVASDYWERWHQRRGRKSNVALATRWLTVGFTLLGVLFALIFRDLVQVIIFITGLGFTIIPAAIASFHLKLSARTVATSFISGVIYVILLIMAGKLVPEYSIASIGVSSLVLMGGWIREKNKLRFRH